MQMQREQREQRDGGSGSSFGRVPFEPRPARHPEEADTGMLPNSPLPKLTTMMQGSARARRPGGKGCGHLNYSPAAGIASPRTPVPRVFPSARSGALKPLNGAPAG